GIHDNFFDLGGASIQTLEVVTLGNQAGLALVPEMIFRHQTIAELAEACGNMGPSAIPIKNNHDSAPFSPGSKNRAVPHNPPLPRPTGGGALVESLGSY